MVDSTLWIAMSGAQETMQAQAVHANNLANATTPGFKAQMETARTIAVYGEGHPASAYVGTELPADDFSGGGFEQTNHPMHVAVKGQGWLAVENAEGVESYTRRGDLTLDAENFLVTGAGHRVLGTGGPIQIPGADSIHITGSGAINIKPIGAAPGTSVTLDQIKLVHPNFDDLERKNDGLFASATGELYDFDPTVQLVSGGFETSNVNPVSELVNIIALTRQFELDLKVMQTSDQASQASAQILQIT